MVPDKDYKCVMLQVVKKSLQVRMNWTERLSKHRISLVCVLYVCACIAVHIVFWWLYSEILQYVKSDMQFLFLWIGWIRKFICKDRWNVNRWWNILGFGLIVNKSKGWSTALLHTATDISFYYRNCMFSRLCGILTYNDRDVTHLHIKWGVAVGPNVIGAGTRHLPPSRIHAPVTNPR